MFHHTRAKSPPNCAIQTMQVMNIICIAATRYKCLLSSNQAMSILVSLNHSRPSINQCEMDPYKLSKAITIWGYNCVSFDETYVYIV